MGRPLHRANSINMLLITLLFCSMVAGIEIAPYSVIKDHSSWEERDYPARKWVSIDGVSYKSNEAGIDYFPRLYNYINVQNSDGQKIDMTAPVSFKVDRETGNFTMSFFIPEVHQASPPQPNDEEVYIEERPAMRMAAKIFGEYPSDRKIKEELAQLRDQAVGEGLQVVDEVYYSSGYSWTRNEVWLQLN